ncbi:MAG: sensor histidine kinase [Blastocatellia bacterium]
MSLRRQFILYLLLTHLLFAGVALYLLSQHRLWLLPVEAVFILSLVCGWRLIGRLFGTLDLIQTGTHFLADHDFTTRFRETGQPELDRLIEIYNRMADGLRHERTLSQEQQYFLERVLTASPTGVITLDFDQRIATLNPAAERMLQNEATALTGKRLDELPMPLAHDLARLVVNEARVLSLTGRRRIKCQRAQFLDRGFTRDFLLLEELTDELRRTEKTAYERVIRLMSHEVNNSVGAANSLLHSCLAYAAQLPAEDEADLTRALTVSIERTQHLNQFMRNFAGAFRLPAPVREPCDVGALLTNVIALFQAECEQRRIAITWRENTAPLVIQCDAAQLEQALVNIIKNAIEAIGAAGTITLRLLPGRLVIEDNGGGISDEARRHLFTPFFSTRPHGQGIGLTLIQEILDAHGFPFALESAPDQTTQFTIWLR